MNKVFVIVSHPDDEVLGCGGTMAKLRAEGIQVESHILVAGRGTPLDQKLDTVPLLTWITHVENLVKRYHPDTIFTHCASDLNRDHRVVNEAVMVATRPPNSVKKIYCFDVTSDWGFGQFGRFKPNVFFSLAPQYVDEKITSMEAYREEARGHPHPRSPEMIRALAQRWGSVIGVPYAEAFELIKMIK